ncbi:MAG: type IV secretion system protein VirB10 [Caulobacter sp.]|nr:type IV secretion system protein VirB10 [Caulobacter sp.]
MTESQETGETTAAPLDRTITPVAGRLVGGRRGRAVALVALVIGCGVFVATTWGDDTPEAPKPSDTAVRQVVAYEPPAAPTLASPGPDAPTLVPGAAGSLPALEPGAPSSARTAPPPVRTEGSARTPMIAYRRQGGGEAAPEGPAPLLAAVVPTELDQLRRGSAIGRSTARRLGDRNYLIVAGASLPCILQTAMDSATPGYVSCLIPRDVLSDNGAVVLMEKGTRVLGEYRSGMRQGQRRLFVLWTRAVTPTGVAVDLASPASDALGRAGFDGDLDSHFWERFGGAALLSVLDSGAYAATGSADGATRLPSDAAGIALQNSVGIGPTLRKAQGAEVSIFAAQDFDFSAVYGLRAR